MTAWVLWAVLAVALAVGEIFTPGLFFLGPVALAAIAAGAVALGGLGAAVQLIVFIVGTVASLAVLRPIARAHIKIPPAATNRNRRARGREGHGRPTRRRGGRAGAPRR